MLAILGTLVFAKGVITLATKRINQGFGGRWEFNGTLNPRHTNKWISLVCP